MNKWEITCLVSLEYFKERLWLPLANSGGSLVSAPQHRTAPAPNRRIFSTVACGQLSKSHSMGTNDVQARTWF